MIDFSTGLALLNLFGALNGLLLGVLLLGRASDRRSAAFYLGALLLVSSLAVALITAEHQAWVPRQWWLYATEESLSLLAGPLLVSFVARSLARSNAPSWIYLPPILYAAVSYGSIGMVQRTLGMEHVMWIQIAYSVAAGVIFLSAARNDDRASRKSIRSTGLILLCIFLIHTAQIVRAAFSEVQWVRDVVPATATVFFYALLIYALLQSRILRSFGPPRTPESSATLDRVLAAVDKSMKETRPWADPSLDLGRLSALVGQPPHLVSAAINSRKGQSFYAYIASYRLAEAKGLLADPDEQRYTVEGIARQCGFGSRSAFYKLFKQETGLSPAEYRNRRLTRRHPA